MTEPQLSIPDLKRRAASGVMVVGARGLLLRAISLAGLLVSASLLGPAEFGVVAFGLSITFVAHFLSDGGLAPSLIRRLGPPTAEEYSAAVGAQATITLAIVTAFGAAAFVSGNRTLVITAVFLAGLPMLAFRLPAFISLERQLRFGPSITAEIAEVLIYNVWAIGGLVLGFGVYALATGAVIKTLSGTLILNAISPVGWVVPRLRFAPIRPLLTFGLKFQGSQAVILARDQLLNLAIAATAGYALLGIWAIAGRLISVPLLLFESLWRISFPALSRLREAGELSPEIVRKGVQSGAIVSCGILAMIAAASRPGIELLLGPRWADAAALMPSLCLGLAAFGAIDVVARGFLMAEDDPTAVLFVYAAMSIVMLSLALPLLPLLGLWALAIAWALGHGVGALAFDRALSRMIRVRLAGSVLPAFVSGICAATAGLAVRTAVDNSLLQLLVVSVVTGSLYGLLITSVDRDGIRLVWRLVRQARPGRNRTVVVPTDP